MAIPQPQPSGRVVITGASSGIGEAIAVEFARRGHQLLLVARREERLRVLGERLAESFGVTADIQPCDLSESVERAALIDQLNETTIEALVNNAGFATLGPLARADHAREREQVTLNVVAVHELTMAVLPAMVERGQGAILLTGSCAGNQPCPIQATYGATKAFVNSLAESLHFELRATGVTCTLLAPGPVHTEFAEVANFAEIDARLPEWAWVSAERAAREAVQAMEAGRRRVIPGSFAKLQTVAGRHSPIGMSGPLVHRAFRHLAVPSAPAV